MRNRFWVVGLALASLASAAAAADTAEIAAAKHWQALTRGDVDAAYRLLEENHPGAVVALGDSQFRRQLREGYRAALARTSQVRGYSGYVATMLGFANSIKDEHIWSRSIYGAITVQWAGLLVSKKGSHWIVADTDVAEKRFAGAEIVSCDGKSPADLGRERIGAFRADWRIAAQQVKRAPLLLIDDGNPFLERPASCELRVGTATQALKLDWRDVARTDLIPRVGAAAGFGHAGYGVKPFAQGTWIALEGLGSQAPAVLDEVRGRLDDIRKSPLVVIDLRGNGGGNSAYGHELATMLLGEEYVASVMHGSADVDCPSLWRVSPDNIKTLVSYKGRFADRFGPEYEHELDTEIVRARKALSRGAAFTAPVRCSSEPKPAPPKELPAWPATFKLVVLTDGACFSSCLLVTDELRRLGAVHVGQATDAATRYMEVREVKLPSGLGYFSTLQKADLSSPPQVGPYEPDHLFDGDIADTSAVQRWIADTLAH
jgi:hypothetical protein